MSDQGWRRLAAEPGMAEPKPTRSDAGKRQNKAKAQLKGLRELGNWSTKAELKLHKKKQGKRADNVRR